MRMQKIVLRVCMVDAKQRSKALKATTGLPGIISAVLDGNQIMVIGDGTDSMELTRVLRKKMGFAELVSCETVGADQGQQRSQDHVVGDLSIPAELVLTQSDQSSPLRPRPRQGFQRNSNANEEIDFRIADSQIVVEDKANDVDTEETLEAPQRSVSNSQDTGTEENIRNEPHFEETPSVMVDTSGGDTQKDVERAEIDILIPACLPRPESFLPHVPRPSTFGVRFSSGIINPEYIRNRELEWESYLALERSTQFITGHTTEIPKPQLHQEDFCTLQAVPYNRVNYAITIAKTFEPSFITVMRSINAGDLPIRPLPIVGDAAELVNHWRDLMYCIPSLLSYILCHNGHYNSVMLTNMVKLLRDCPGTKTWDVTPIITLAELVLSHCDLLNGMDTNDAFRSSLTAGVAAQLQLAQIAEDEARSALASTIHIKESYDANVAKGGALLEALIVEHAAANADHQTLLLQIERSQARLDEIQGRIAVLETYVSEASQNAAVAAEDVTLYTNIVTTIENDSVAASQRLDTFDGEVRSIVTEARRVLRYMGRHKPDLGTLDEDDFD